MKKIITAILMLACTAGFGQSKKDSSNFERYDDGTGLFKPVKPPGSEIDILRSRLDSISQRLELWIDKVDRLYEREGELDYMLWKIADRVDSIWAVVENDDGSIDRLYESVIPPLQAEVYRTKERLDSLIRKLSNPNPFPYDWGQEDLRPDQLHPDKLFEWGRNRAQPISPSDQPNEPTEIDTIPLGTCSGLPISFSGTSLTGTGSISNDTLEWIEFTRLFKKKPLHPLPGDLVQLGRHHLELWDGTRWKRLKEQK